MRIANWLMAVAAVAAVAAMAMFAPLAAADPAEEEVKLIDTLTNSTDWFAREAACRRLRQIGTTASIPALAALLPDPELSGLARYALEPMPYPEAGQALRNALASVQGLQKAGVVASLGARQDLDAVDLLLPLLADADLDVARAAAGALGRIGRADAVQGLLDASKTAGPEMKPALIDGMLAAVQRLRLAGQFNMAMPVLNVLLAPDWPTYARAGAMRELCWGQPSMAMIVLMEALTGADSELRDLAAQIVAETTGAESTEKYGALLTTLPAEGQVALIRGLAGRKDRGALPAIVQAAHASDLSIRTAAVKALGTLGTAADVPLLIGYLSPADDGKDEVAVAAKAGLETLQADGVDAAIGAAIPEAKPELGAALLELLARRGAEQAVTMALGKIASDDALLRMGALRALAIRGETVQGPAVLDALMKAAEPAERSAAENALNALVSRDKAGMQDIVLGPLPAAAPEAKMALLRAAGRIGGGAALDAVVAQLDDVQAGAEAVRLLSNWETPDALPHLQRIAQSEDLGRHVLGLRGFVRLAQAMGDAGKKVQLLNDAQALAQRPDEKILVFAAWATVPAEQTLNVLKPYLDDPEVKNEAALAIITAAGEFAKAGADQKALAVAAINAVIEKCADAAAIVDKAKATIAAMP